MIPGTISYASLGTTKWTMPPRPEGPAPVYPSAHHIRESAAASRGPGMPATTFCALLNFSEQAYPELSSGASSANN